MCSSDLSGAAAAYAVPVSDGAGNVSYQQLIPPGVIMPYGGTAAPIGYLLCDGTSYLRATYANLFSAIGTAFGAADGTHFNVPDMRGQFLRGVTGSSTKDPDASSRTAMNTGGNTGNNVGSVQSDQFKSHTHSVIVDPTASSPGSYPAAVNAALGLNTTGSNGGNETRPTNAYVNYIIKI